MKKLTKAIISSVCAVSMLAGTAISASAHDLTAEELFEKYSSTYYWYSSTGYWYNKDFLTFHGYETETIYYDADGNEIVENVTGSLLDGRARYKQDNPYRIVDLKKDEFHPVYNCEFEEGFYYAIKEDGTAVIAGCDYDYIIERTPTAINIPEEIGGAVVTEIAQYAFQYANQYKQNFTSVSIPDTVEVIGSHAFIGTFRCNKYTLDDIKGFSINIPKNVRYIGNVAYGLSTDLALGEVIVLPESLELMYASSFAYPNGDYSPHAPILMPESLVFVDTDPYEEWCMETYFVDGKYNTVTLKDAEKYLLEKEQQVQKPPVITIGDLNANGEIDLTDAVLLGRALSGEYELTAELRAAADVNGDNSVDAADLAILMDLLAGN